MIECREPSFSDYMMTFLFQVFALHKHNAVNFSLRGKRNTRVWVEADIIVQSPQKRFFLSRESTIHTSESASCSASATQLGRAHHRHRCYSLFIESKCAY